MLILIYLCLFLICCSYEVSEDNNGRQRSLEKI